LVSNPGYEYSGGGYSYNEYDDYYFYELGMVGIVTGSALILSGITFRILGKYSVRKAVESYNSLLYSSSGSYTPELRFGFTGHGVGLVYRF
jgi:hypothetical protein